MITVWDFIKSMQNCAVKCAHHKASGYIWNKTRVLVNNRKRRILLAAATHRDFKKRKKLEAASRTGLNIISGSVESSGWYWRRGN